MKKTFLDELDQLERDAGGALAIAASSIPKLERRREEREREREERNFAEKIGLAIVLPVDFAAATATSRGPKKPNCNVSKSHFCKTPKGRGSCVSLKKQCRYTPDGLPRQAANAVGKAVNGGKGGGKAAQIAAAQQEVDRANADVTLINKRYSNHYASLTQEERARFRELQINPDRVFIKDLEAARKRAFEAKQRLDALNPSAARRVAPPATGPMSVAESRAPLTAEERQVLRNTLTLRGDRNYSRGRIDLAHDRDAAASALRRVQATRQDLKTLSVEDAQAIRAYTDNSYVGVNGAMRGLQSDPTSDLAQRQRILARATQQAVEKLPAYEGTVRRDTRLSAAELAQFTEGSTMSFKGLTSTSTDLAGSSAGSYGSTESLTKASFFREKAERQGIQVVADGRDMRRVEFRLDIKSGRDIGALSSRTFENEVLLPHGWQGKVNRVEEAGNRTIVYMEEV
jgi:hypothetical protein